MKTTNEKISLRNRNFRSDRISRKMVSPITITYVGIHMMYIFNSIFYTPFYRCVRGYKIKSGTNTEYSKLNKNNNTFPPGSMIEVWDIDKKSIINNIRRNRSIKERGMR